MTTTVDSLAADLQRFFASRFPGGGDGPGSLLLVFDPLGRPLPINEFVGSGGAGITDVLSHQWAAQCADELPAANMLSQGVFLARDGSRLSRWYSAVLEGCATTATADAAARSFQRAHGAALALLGRNKIDVVITGTAAGAAGTAAPVGTTDVYYATGMTPVGWFLDGATCWQTYRYDAHDQPASPTTAAPAGVVSPPAFEFRVADAETPEILAYARTGKVPELLVPTQPDDLRLELPEHAYGLYEEPKVGVPYEAGTVEVGIDEPELATDPAAFAVLMQDDLIEPTVLPAATVVAKTTPQPANADGFHVSFEHCLVRFTRPWWDDVFLARSDWSLPGYRPGQVSSGSASQPAGTAITLMTVGMLVIRNLRLQANWSDRDERAIRSSVSFGPFSLAGAAFDSASGTVSHDGMQAIAWLCQVPQQLPPAPA